MIRKIVLYVVVAILLLVTLGSHQTAHGQDPYANLKKPVSDRGQPLPVGQAVQNDRASMPQALAGVGDWSKIAYQSYMSGNWEIYLTDGNGNNLINLTNIPAADFGPRLARGAAKLVFTSNRDGNDEIYTSLSSGEGLSRLTYSPADDYAPDWSPQGDRIVFVSERDGNPEIYMMNADGTGQTRLTYDPALDTSPAWSPDGQRIVWVQYQDNIYGDIMMMDASGANQVLYFNNARFLGAVAWAPDSAKLIADFDIDGDFWNEIVQFEPQNGYKVLLDANQEFVDLWVGGFSPDGKWVIFSRVEYLLDGNQLYINHTFVDMKQMEYPDTYARLPGVGFELDPDWEIADIDAPTSHVLSLPPLSRQNRLYVSWTGSDIGPAGITYYQLQYRLGQQGVWTDWYLSDSLALSSLFPFGSAGDKVYFRSRARDAAGNYEAWPANPDGDAFTSLYTWRVAGSVSDNRGRPIFQPEIQVSPAPINLLTHETTNDYKTWMGSANQVTFQAAQSGYAAFPPANLNLNADLQQDFYLPPQEGLLVNGGFEDQLAGWQITGTSTMTEALGQAHTGQSGLFLNEPCPAPCFSYSGTIMDYFSQSDMVSLQDGTLVVVYSDNFSNPSQLYAVTRPPGGVLGSPIFIGSFPLPTSGNNIALDTDGQDNLYAVWQGGGGIYYSDRLAQGSWTSPQLIAPGAGQPDLSVDPQGGVHIIYRADAGLVNYLERKPEGGWQTPVSLNSGSGHNYPGIAAGPDGTVYFIWQEYLKGIFFRSKLPNGVLTPIECLFAGWGSASYSQRIAVGPHGELHAFWVWPYNGYYTYRPPREDWQPAVALPGAYGPADLVVDSQGVVHMIGYSMASEGYYRTKNPVTGWTDPVTFFPEYIEHRIAIDSLDRVHILTRNSRFYKWDYRTLRPASQARTVSASQQVTIPPGTLAPTLSFFYTLDNLIPAGQTFFQVTVEDGKGSTPVFTASANSFWTQAWADLTPWVDQSVTVTFSLHQAAGEPEAQLSIDDISLGNWLTPQVDHVTPAKLAYDWFGQVITINGKNFMPGATAYLGDILLIDLQWIDQGVLQASLPAGILPGVYDVWVVNPGLQRAVLIKGLSLGNLSYLPVIFR